MPDDDKAHFPRKYNENYLYLLEVDPTHIHACWEIMPDCIPDQILKRCLSNKDFWLKIYCSLRDRHTFCVDLNVQGLINDWFVEIESPLTRCHAELGYKDPGEEKFISLCRSNNLDVILEKEFSDYSTEKKKQSHVSSNEFLEKQKDINPFIVDTEKKEKKHPMEFITEKDIKDHYRLLSENRIFNPGYSPWKSILERINSAEALRVLKPSVPVNLCKQNYSPSETDSSYSSYWSATFSYSPIPKIDKDK
ncbi:MAG: DUF4912 domain-containing protein [bacterium]